MKTTPVTPEDLRGVFPVPPLARKTDSRRIDFALNDRLVRHMSAGGLTRFLYGGNAFLYHVTLDEYEELLGWLAGFSGALWAIPSLGPSFGRAMDQARLACSEGAPGSVSSTERRNFSSLSSASSDVAFLTCALPGMSSVTIEIGPAAFSGPVPKTRSSRS